jgi:hypothetical protein
VVPRKLGWRKRKRATLSNSQYGVTVSYRNENVPMVTSRAGYGKTFANAIRDADSQLPDGTWRRIVVSHPGTTFSDLQTTRAARFARSTMRRGENVVVRVEKRVTTEIPER